jgi:hypothetical protein
MTKLVLYPNGTVAMYFLEASPTETKARRRRQFCVELCYHFSCYGLLFLFLQFRSIYFFMAAMFLH